MMTPPKFKGFKPFGYYLKELEPVIMFFEEYEAIRLCDYELLNQQEASEIMGISRSTITRIYQSARRKVALSFSEARAIIIGGGRVYFDKDWLQCKKCSSIFNNSGNKSAHRNCPVCNSSQIFRADTISN
jgi:predicted DNA-binding protein (UPF0251 family)